MDKKDQVAKFLDKVNNAIDRSGLNSIEVLGLLGHISHSIHTHNYEKTIEIEGQMEVDQ